MLLRLAEVAHPGVAPINARNHTEYHGYYQWISYILVIQAALLYIPKCLWSNWEGKQVQTLMNQAQSYFSSQSTLTGTEEKTPEIFNYFLSKHRVGQQNSYFWKLVACEFLNLLTTVSQILMTNFLLGFSFSQIVNQATEVLSIRDPISRNDSIAELFPTVTKCLFNTYGPSGSIQTNDALCVLPFNVIHEKIYILMWYA